MARWVKVAAAQMGPINEGTSREECVDRMLALLDQAIKNHVELIAYPEMALTTYFPKRIREDYDWMTPARKRWDFFSRRHPKFYGAITQEKKA